MPQDPTDDQSKFVQVMPWCRQAAIHFLGQYFPKSLSPYGVTWPQIFNVKIHNLSVVNHKTLPLIMEYNGVIQGCKLDEPPGFSGNHQKNIMCSYLITDYADANFVYYFWKWNYYHQLYIYAYLYTFYNCLEINHRIFKWWFIFAITSRFVEETDCYFQILRWMRNAWTPHRIFSLNTWLFFPQVLVLCLLYTPKAWRRCLCPNYGPCFSSSWWLLLVIVHRYASLFYLLRQPFTHWSLSNFNEIWDR